MVLSYIIIKNRPDQRKGKLLPIQINANVNKNNPLLMSSNRQSLKNDLKYFYICVHFSIYVNE